MNNLRCQIVCRAVIFLLLGLMSSANILMAQYFDNVWLIGYNGGNQTPTDTNFGISVLDFTDAELSITNNQISPMNFNDTDASISNEVGELLFYFNGIYLENASNQLIFNGDTLNDWNQFGYDLPQGGLIIPYPGHDNQYLLLHAEEGYIELPGWGLQSVGLYYSLIDMESNDGLGNVTMRKVPLVIDTLDYGKITGVRHANGRDWWLLINKSLTNEYYRILISDKGLQVIDKQKIGVSTPLGLGQAVFSPDGSKYVKFNTIDLESGSFIDIYDFDRCSGRLSDHKQINFNDYSLSAGLAIAPNSVYMYVITLEYVYQFDLSAEDISASKEVVAVYDGYKAPFPTTFYQAQLALDGKIYFATSSGSKFLHVIDKPNVKGVECNVKQHAIKLPTYNARSIPNFINYRLGPLDGSFCDTIGVNNNSLALFRLEIDSNDPYVVHFFDLSSYEPTSWHWDVDNSFFSSNKNPSLNIAEKGVHEICLTVSNVYGSDTFCKSVLIGTTSVVDNENSRTIAVRYDIASNSIHIDPFTIDNGNYSFYLYDYAGKLILEKTNLISTHPTIIQLTSIPRSIYVYSIVANNSMIDSGTMFKN